MAIRANRLEQIVQDWQVRPGGPERRLRRYGSLLLRIVTHGVLVVVFASAVLALALLLFGAAAFRSAPMGLGLLVVSLAAGFLIARPARRTLIDEHRFRCFYCEGETARARRHDSMASDAHARRQIRYSFHCERCGNSDGEL